MPLDPIEVETGDSLRNTPQFLDENPNRDMVATGLNASENELRDAADEEFGTDPSLPIEAEVFEDDDELAPEVAAMHEFTPPN